MRSLTAMYKAMIDRLTGRALGKTAIRDRLATLDGVEFVCIGVVAIGLVGESLSVPHAGDVVTLGVLGEFILHWFHVRASKRSEEVADKEAEAARGAIADANARAAEANEKAERERLERMKIEARLAWRRFSPEQIGSIASKLNAFRPERVAVFRSKLEPEIASFAGQITSALEDAGWNVGLATKTDFDRIVVGVLVELDSKDGIFSQDVAFGAVALVEALHAEGVLVYGPAPLQRVGFSAQCNEGDLEAPLQIMVGTKPG